MRQSIGVAASHDSYMAPTNYLTIWPGQYGRSERFWKRMQDDPRRSRTLALLPEEMGSDPVSNSQTKERNFAGRLSILKWLKKKPPCLCSFRFADDIPGGVSLETPEV
jgi:hypothetical protein